MARVRAILKPVLIWGSVLVLLGTGAFLFLARAEVGQALVFERVLAVARGRIHGTLVVEGIHTASLLRGMTLRGVRVEDAAGRLFLEADSLAVAYSLRSLVTGDLRFNRVEIWRPRVTVERLPGQDEVNAVRIFSGGEEAGGGEGADEGARGLELRDVRVHGGRIQVRLPLGEAEEAPASLVEDVPGGRVRSYVLEEIEAEMPRVRIGGEEGGEELEVRTLAFTGRIFEDPFHIRDFRGTARREGSRISFDAERLWLPDSEFGGTGQVDWGAPGGLAVDAELEGTAVRLSDLRFLEARLPDAGGAFDLDLELREGVTTLRLEELDLLLEGSRVRGRLGVRTGDGAPELLATELRPQPMDLRHLNPWLEEPLPVEGRVRGRLELEGPLADLRVGGRLTLEEPGSARPPSTAEIGGTLHLGEDALAVTDLSLVLDPFYFGLAARVDERIALRGPGTATVIADGRLGGDMTFDVRLTHRPATRPHSAVSFRGTARESEGALRMDVTGQLEPLSLTALAAAYPDLPVSGEVTGSVQLRGPLSDLDVRTRLVTPGGVLPLAARLDVRDPGARYRLEADLEDFELSTLMPSLPGPILLTGRALVDGRGLELDSLEGTGELELRGSRVGHLGVGSLTARLRAGGGTLRLDTLVARTSAVDLEGGGTLAMAEGVPGGELVLEMTSDSLGGIRPFLLGDTVIARDTLSAIERNILEMEGVNPDTLPTEAAVTMDGRLRGRAVLRGSVRDFTATGSLRVDEVVYGTNFLEGADLEFDVEGLPGFESRMRGTLTADSVRIGERGFAGGEIVMDYTRPEGRVEILVVRSDVEDYRALATFETDSLGGVVHLDELTLRFDPVRWNLGGPASVSWNDDGITIRDLRLIRPGQDRMRILLDGRLPFRGDADFRVEMDSLSLEHLARLAQTDRSMEGTLNLRMNVQGDAGSPVMDGTVQVRDLRYDSIAFSLVQGGIRYRDRAMTVGLLAWQGDAVALTVDGRFPVDLAFRDVETRYPDEEMDLRIRIDSLPAAGVLSFLDGLEDVQGTLKGEAQVAGTLQDPSPSGTIRLHDGGARFPALGIAMTGAQGTFELTPDGTIQVDAEARSGGVAAIQGSIKLDPASDPSLDLRISARGFRGADRRDMTARVGGEVSLGGTYRRPLLEGEVTVDQGVLFLEEFARGAQVVDLSDPAFFDVVDTALVSVRPFLAESQNPFLSNLRMDVDLSVERDSWIRSPDINVELQGDLSVVYDRTSKQLTLLGQLQAVRGSYNAYGRRFEVQGGTVEFVGTPGLNPSLNIEARTRLRRPSQEPLDITANVRGTLTNPRVGLTSDAQPPISQPDLVSYLIFGRPAGLLAPGERSVAGGAGQLLGGIASAGASLGLGTLTAQLSSAVAQEIGFFDYFAITTEQQPGLVGSSNPLAQTFTQSLASAQVELGRYFFEDVFVAVLLRPLTGLAGTESVSRPGVRVEWRFADLWTVEGFVEDRFARSGGTGFGDLGFRPEQVLGLSLFREWGY